MNDEKIILVESRHEYADVYTYYFKSINPLAYQAGWYGHMRLSGLPDDVKAVREFSFASAPHEELIQFGIDHRSNSPYQQKMKSLKSGDEVGLFKLKGHMNWPPLGREAVMIAGGIGITPIRSFLVDSSFKKLPLTNYTIHVSSDNFLYENEISKLASDYIKTNRGGLPTELENSVTKYKNATYYVVGSNGFVESAIQKLDELGIARIESDVFKGLSDES